MKEMKKSFFMIQWLSVLILMSNLSWAIGNPAASYCKLMGYKYTIEKKTNGSMKGKCIFPDGSSTDAWDFFRGKEKKMFSYCSKKGYTMETIVDHSKGYTQETPVCMPKQKERGARFISMVDLMKENGDMPDRKYKLFSGKISHVSKISKRTKTNLPLNFDWRNYNGHSYIGSIRDQGECGDCYAYAASASAEGVYNVANNKFDEYNVDFSEDFLAWCLGKYGPYESHFSGCDGADYDYAELAALTKEGITDETHYPTVNEDPGSCTHKEDPIVSFQKWGRIASGDENAIKSAILAYGVIEVAIQTTDNFIDYTNGIFSDTQTECPDGANTETDHAVALVGWGVENDELYWILRNSWSENWGENGYMRIKAHSARVACAAAYLQYRSFHSLSLVPIVSYLLSED